MVFLGRFLVYSYLVFAIFLPADAETERQRATSVNLSLSPSHSLPLASSTLPAYSPMVPLAHQNTRSASVQQGRVHAPLPLPSTSIATTGAMVG